MSVVAALVNQKGGVGKTTVAVHYLMLRAGILGMKSFSSLLLCLATKISPLLYKGEIQKSEIR